MCKKNITYKFIEKNGQWSEQFRFNFLQTLDQVFAMAGGAVDRDS